MSNKTLAIIKPDAIKNNYTGKIYNLILYNKWWNPSNNNQARDRVHRIGQQKTVNIYNLICTNTVEEHLENICLPLMMRKFGLEA